MNTYDDYTTSMQLINTQAIVGKKWKEKGYNAEIVAVIHKCAGGSAYPICRIRYQKTC